MLVLMMVVEEQDEDRVFMRRTQAELREEWSVTESCGDWR